ncbi:MAG: hypothetical protein KDA87_12130 [Planctomycetales bacterium]|nr:hypothetical protein [Planctomycetales bacterium]
MKNMAKLVSLVALIGTFGPSFVFLANGISLETAAWISLFATIVWFIATPMWMGRLEHEIDEESPMI